jgi:hypothetical protein
MPTPHIHPSPNPAAPTSHLSTPPNIFSFALAAAPVYSLGEADVGGGGPTVLLVLVVVLGTNELSGGSGNSDVGGGTLEPGTEDRTGSVVLVSGIKVNEGDGAPEEESAAVLDSIMELPSGRVELLGRGFSVVD